MNKTKTNPLLDYKYPGFLYKYPNLIKIVYVLNYLVQLRKWHIYPLWKKMLFDTSPNFIAMDIGCGEGQYMIPFCKQYSKANFIAIDIRKSNQDFINAFNLNNIQSICLDIENEVPKNQADMAICVGVMQYFQNDKVALSNIYNSLKTNGQFLLYVPINGTIITPFYKYIFNKYTQYESINNRKRVYNEIELKEKLELAGFRITNKIYTFGNAGKLSHELTNSCSTLIFSASFPLKIVACIAFVLLLPFIFILMIIDFYSKKSTGNGLLLKMIKK